MLQLRDIEKRAHDATRNSPFAINLSETKRTVEKILQLFGRGGMFNEYTIHDIEHVNDLIETIEWLIPDSTKRDLTDADCLMIVLSAYFHDIGLVITDEEFGNRNVTQFDKFVHDKLYAGPSGADYRESVASLDKDAAERFLYQEFVRAHHGARVRRWIEGDEAPELGYASAQLQEIQRLLSPLDEAFRKDLALVCESHNLDDISDLEKYKVSRPYGNSDEQTANVQYACVILRTADLIQITRNRAPSTLFKLINPTDPVSQTEWLKQNSVKRVRSQEGKDRDGSVSRDAHRDTIEIFANFKDGAAFFGLNSYLAYAQRQIQESHSVVNNSKKLLAKNYEFPWRFIDDNNIEVEGFIKKPFGFEIDQHKILDLLTGHTLYNNSDVVVREIVQNSLDAVRLQEVKGKNPKFSGSLTVSWEESSSTLAILDNGTGMTQNVIENHLLKVGSSQYQDSKFKEAYPNFSPISRFGIGVLSSFMVADSVDIFTVTAEEEQARHISLRSVHGKYLIRLLDKRDEQVRHIGPHGTLFRLKFRPSALRVDILKTVKSWVLFPRCDVAVILNEGPAINVGFDDPRAAVKNFLETPLMARWGGKAQYEVKQTTAGGQTFAFAVRYSPHYRDWNFVGLPDARWGAEASVRDEAPFGSCIEGIAVEPELPGFHGHHLLAVSESRGKHAPKTNVARSMIEETEEKRAVARATYAALFSFATEEMRRLQSEEEYSLTWAVNQMPFILGPILENNSSRVRYRDIHREEILKVPMLLVEENGSRKAISLSDLEASEPFWTVDSRLHRSIEQFIKEAKAEITTDQLLRASQGTASSIPAAPILVNLSSHSVVGRYVSQVFEVSEISGEVRDRRLDLKWAKKSDRWISRDDILKRLYDSGRQEIFAAIRTIQDVMHRENNITGDVLSPVGHVDVGGLDDYFAVSTHGNFFILPNMPVSEIFKQPLPLASSPIDMLMTQFVDLSAVAALGTTLMGDGQPLTQRFYKTLEDRVPNEWLVGQERVMSAVSETIDRLRVFDPMAWNQREFQEHANEYWF